MTPSDSARRVAPSSPVRRPVVGARPDAARTRVADEADPTLSDPGLGWVLAVELLTATLVWGGIGWLLDRWLGTAPWLMAIGFVVGNGAGIYLVWLKTGGPDAGFPRQAPTREGEPGAND